MTNPKVWVALERLAPGALEKKSLGQNDESLGK